MDNFIFRAIFVRGKVFVVRLSDELWMSEAILEAEKAGRIGEVPIGAVIVWNDIIIGRGHNLRERNTDPLAHAEVLAIAEASRFLRAWRLTGCTLYVTLEPCPMCAGALIQSRVDRVVYAARDPKAGCVHSLIPLLDETRFNHRVAVTEGVLRERCSTMLSDFFRTLRARKKNPPATD